MIQWLQNNMEFDVSKIFKNWNSPINMWTSQVVLVIKNLPANAGDTRDVGLVPGSGRSLGEGNGNPLQYSCLKNSMDRGPLLATVHGVAKSQTQLNMHAHTPSFQPWSLLLGHQRLCPALCFSLQTYGCRHWSAVEASCLPGNAVSMLHVVHFTLLLGLPFEDQERTL